MDGIFVGRIREADLIHRALEEGRAVLLEGEPGLGKTTLVRHLFGNDATLLLAGRFTPESSLPYQAFSKAFEALCFHLLALPELEVDRWRTLARELIVGRWDIVEPAFPQWVRFAQASPDSLAWMGTPADAQRALQGALTSWWKAWGEAGQATVLFIDDLQWADSASLDLFSRWTRLNTATLGLVGASRSDAGGRCLADLPGDLELVRIRLSPLLWNDTEQLVALTLPDSPEETLCAMTEKAYGTTGGHPLYLAQWLHNQCVGSLSAETTPETLGPDAVLPFLKELYSRLPFAVGELLGAASFLDEEFSPQDLSIVTAKPLELCADALELGRRHRFVAQSDHRWVFLHDNLRLAAESLVPLPDRPGLHLRVGQFYGGRSPLLAAHHLSQAWIGGQHFGERWGLIALCRLAGMRAQEGGALALAWRHLWFATQLLKEEDWESRYEETLGLVGEAAQAALWGGAATQRDELAEQLVRRARKVWDRAVGYEVQIQALITIGRMCDAADFCVEVLEALEHPVAPSVEDLSPQELARGRRDLFRWGHRGWGLPIDQTPQRMALGRILVAGMAATFIVRPRRFAPFAFSALGLLLPWRPDPLAAYLVLCFGTAECGWLNNLKGGHQVTTLAWKIHERTGAKEYRGKFLLLFVNTLSQWEVGPEVALDLAQEAMRLSKAQGDFEYAALAAGNHSWLSIEARRPLGETEQICRRNLSFVEDIGYLRGLQTTSRPLQFLHNLKHPGQGPLDELRGPYLDEDRALEVLKASNDRSGIMMLWSTKVHLACLSLAYGRAWDHWKASLPYVDGIRSQTYFISYLKMVVLAGWSLWPGWTDAERLQYEPRLKEYQRTLSTAAHCRPQDHRTFQAFLKLEEDRARGRTRGLDRRYRALDRDMAPSRKWLELGLIRERHALWLETQGRPAEAQVRWKAARDAFASWGAYGVVHFLERWRPALVPVAPTPSLELLMEAGRLISEEIDLAKLVQSVIRLLIDLSGADYGYLRYEGPESPVGAEGWVEGEDVKAALTESPRTSSRVRYRLASLGEGRGEVPLVVEDMSRLSPFPEQEPPGDNPIRALLWIPILHHGKSLGGVLLENALTAGVFTPDRVRVAGLLVSQAAVSLENATLHRVRANLAQEREGMIRSEKLASLGSLTAQVAHEVNNPNHVVRLNAGVIHTLARQVEDREVAAKILRAAQDIEEASARIHRITSELKTSLGRPTEKGVLDLNAVVDSAHRLSESHWASFTRSLKLQKDPQVPAVRGDFDKLRQVVLNLVENACQALESSDATVIIRTRTAGEVAVLEVVDQGAGISPPLLVRVINPFFTTRQASGGTGLGLHIVATIAKEHGAQLSIQSEVGRGTKVSVAFPDIRGSIILDPTIAR